MFPICFSDMERPSAHSHRKILCDWDQSSPTRVSITKPSPAKHVYWPPDCCPSLLQSTFSIPLPRTEKHKRQFTLLLCFHYCDLVANHLFTLLRILEHVSWLIDPGRSSTINRRWGWYRLPSLERSSSKMKSILELSTLEREISRVI